jgi:hypothetical protein
MRCRRQNRLNATPSHGAARKARLIRGGAFVGSDGDERACEFQGEQQGNGTQRRPFEVPVSFHVTPPSNSGSIIQFSSAFKLILVDREVLQVPQIQFRKLKRYSLDVIFRDTKASVSVSSI